MTEEMAERLADALSRVRGAESKLLVPRDVEQKDAAVEYLDAVAALEALRAEARAA